jgi:hypothetical protein
MAVDAQGWLDWAIRTPRTDGAVRVNAGVNGAIGIFFHSAEGYAATLLNLAVNGPLSWHLSNLTDGTLHQHYPFMARCWHATAANTSFVGMEHEGKHDGGQPSLSDAQIDNDVRVIQDLAAWKGWTPERPMSATDKLATLYEHREVVRFGGSSTACPDGRIPWQTILERLAPVADPTTDDQIKALVALAHFLRNEWNLADLSPEDKAAIKAAAEKVPA